MRRKIDDQIAIFKYGNFFRRPCLSLRGAKACKQFRGAKWLGDVIVRAGIQSRYFFLHIITHSKHDDWYFAPFPQAS
jgi:hypothetical protein